MIKKKTGLTANYDSNKVSQASSGEGEARREKEYVSINLSHLSYKKKEIARSSDESDNEIAESFIR